MKKWYSFNNISFQGLVLSFKFPSDFKMAAPVVTFICALYLALANNQSFFKAAFTAINSGGGHNLLLEAALFSSLVLLFFIILQLLAFVRAAFKPLIIILLVLSAAVGYFMNAYGVVVDLSMIQNVMETDYDEATELLTSKLILHVLLFGILPALLVYRVPLQNRGFIPELTKGLIVTGGALVLLVAIVFFNYKNFSLILRNNHELRLLVNPSYPLYSLVKYLKGSKNSPLPLHQLGTDARQHPAWAARGKKTVVVLVVGETARAENFALNGYAQATNPRLSKEDIINFSNTRSCGTATAESLPCMFSNLKQAHYSSAEARESENLLDVLKRAGINVLWLDNNSGCKGVCQRVTMKSTENMKDAALCPNGECYDEIMLRDLGTAIEKMPGDTLIVLHQKGSHGPAYFRRYPERFSVFTPQCTRNEVQDCSRSEITNAYNNTILYTDYLLSEVIQTLKSYGERYNTAMFYMSDHGESLGENGIYLHGLPYAFAPDQQTHIPFILWLSKDYSQAFNVNQECLRQRRQGAYSHDNLFHSILGMLAVETQVYEAEYDVFSACRSSAEAVITRAD